MADLSALSGPVGVPLRPPSAVPTRNPQPTADTAPVSMPVQPAVPTVMPLTQDTTRATFFSHAAAHPRPSSAMPRTSAPILSNFGQSSFTRTLSTVASSLQLGVSSKAALPPPSHGSPGPSALLSVAKARLTARPQSSQSNTASSVSSPSPIQSPLHARPASSQSTRMLPLGATAPAGLEIVTYLPTVHHAPTPSLSPTSTSLIASPSRVATDAPQLSPEPLSPVDLSASPTFTASSDSVAEPETSVEPVEPVISAHAELPMVMTPQALLSLSTLRAPLDSAGNFNLLSKSNSMAGLMSPPRPSSALPRSLSHSSSATILSNNMVSVQRGANLNYSFAAASPVRPLTAAVALSTAADVLQLRQELKSIQNAGAADTPSTVAVRAPLLSPQSRTNTAEVSRFLAARGNITPSKSLSRNASTPALKTSVSPPVSRIVSLHDTSSKLNEILALAAERSDSPPVQSEMFVFHTTAKAEADAAAALARLAPWERSAIRLSASPVNSPASVVPGISSPSASAASRGFVAREVVPFASTQTLPAPSRFDVLQKHYNDGINRILAPPPPAAAVTPTPLTLVVAVAADTPMTDDADITASDVAVPEIAASEVAASAGVAEVVAAPAADKTPNAEAQVSISKSEFELTVDSLSQLASLLDAGLCAPKDAGRMLKAVSQRMASHNSS